MQDGHPQWRLRDSRIACQARRRSERWGASEAALGIEADRARSGIFAGVSLRPKSSLAPIFGSFGLASGGSGFGSTVPLSCARADDAQARLRIRQGIRKWRGCIGMARDRRKLARIRPIAGKALVLHDAWLSAPAFLPGPRLSLRRSATAVGPLQAADGTDNWLNKRALDPEHNQWAGRFHEVVVGRAARPLQPHWSCRVCAPTQALADVVVQIDKSSQRMSVSVNGAHASYNWPVSTGRSGYGTPSGAFHPQMMARRWFSQKYYNSPMPYSIFFYHGFAIHGTNDLGRLGGPASHGCVRLHPSHAAALFALVAAQRPRQHADRDLLDVQLAFAALRHLNAFDNRCRVVDANSCADRCAIRRNDGATQPFANTCASIAANSRARGISGQPATFDRRVAGQLSRNSRRSSSRQLTVATPISI